MIKKINRIKYAIMFTDMLNSTQRYDVQGDDTAFKHVSKHYDILKPIVKDNNGYLVKTAGDSILATFKNPNDGVQAAINMQASLFGYNKGKDLDKTIEVRIGIHYGEILEEDEKSIDIFGDKVNTAARIESMASGYNIFISKQLNEIIDKNQFKTIYIGDYDVKGKLEPITIYGVLWAKNINWLKNLYQQTKKNLENKQNKNRIENERKNGNIGKTGKIGVTASLDVITQPSGAKVWLDDNLFHLQTPFKTDYKVGELNLRIEKPGFRTENDHIELYEHLPNKIFIPLEDLRGSILIETEKRDFSIRINNLLKQKIAPPYKYSDMLPDKYFISVKSDTQFSYPEEIELKEKQHIIFKPQVIFFSNIAITSQYNENILIVELLNKPNSTYTKKIKYKTDNKYIKGISQELKLEPGRYLIKSEMYPFLKVEIEINSAKFSIIDFDELIPKVEFKAICGKYKSNIIIDYENRTIDEKTEQSGDIVRQIFPGKSTITLKYKSIQKKIEHDFSESSIEYNFEDIIKKNIRLNIFSKIAIIVTIILLSFCMINFGPRFYNKYISYKIIQINKETVDSKEDLLKFAKSEEVVVFIEKIKTGGSDFIDSVIAMMKKNPRKESTEINNSEEYMVIPIIAIKDSIKVDLLEPRPDVPQNLVYVRGGKVKMKSKASNNIEKLFQVELDDFYIGKFEVTQEEWEQIFQDNPAIFKESTHPIENIDWVEAIKYCNRRSELEGLTRCYVISESKVTCDFKANGYRLPTEAEWEFAAKGGTKTKNYIYSGSDLINEVAWFQGNSSGTTHPIGKKTANELGIYDMSGNVWELCWDLYGKYPEKMQKNPKGSKSGTRRTRRQGSWNRSEEHSRVGFRETVAPNMKSESIGFRYVRTTLGE